MKVITILDQMQWQKERARWWRNAKIFDGCSCIAFCVLLATNLTGLLIYSVTFDLALGSVICLISAIGSWKCFKISRESEKYMLSHHERLVRAIKDPDNIEFYFQER